MAARSFVRGWPIHWTGEEWLYDDTGEPCDDDTIATRPCAHCGRMPTPEGHDACLGHIEGATSVCCGHGIHAGYWMDEDGEMHLIG